MIYLLPWERGRQWRVVSYRPGIRLGDLEKRRVKFWSSSTCLAGFLAFLAGLPGGFPGNACWCWGTGSGQWNEGRGRRLEEAVCVIHGDGGREEGKVQQVFCCRGDKIGDWIWRRGERESWRSAVSLPVFLAVEPQISDFKHSLKCFKWPGVGPEKEVLCFHGTGY